MTSGISAKGSALGADASEGGVTTNRAPLPRAPGNGTKRSRGSQTGTNVQEAGITETPETSAGSPAVHSSAAESTAAQSSAAESPHPVMSSSVRTLILGIDYDGRIVQHDRNAAKILALKPEDLLGAQLIEQDVHGSSSGGSTHLKQRHVSRAPIQRSSDDVAEAHHGLANRTPLTGSHC